MLQKFVYWTGFLDFLIGAGVWTGALMNPQPNQFVPLMTLGMFLMMAAACLMWASKNMAYRAPVIFWQGLVRLTAVCSILYAIPNGLSHPAEYAVAAFDGVIALTYIFGMIKVTGLHWWQLVMCKPPLSST